MSESAESILLRIEPVRERFERAWHSNDNPRIDEFLLEWEGAARCALFEQLLGVDLHFRKQAGQVVEPADYADRFPEFLEVIDRIFREPLDPSRDTDASLDPTQDATPPASSSQALRLPQQVGNYLLVEEIGRGGMGIVYRAKQINLKRYVAVKMILAGDFANDRELQRFRAEAEAAARLEHPNIVSVYEVGNDNGRLFFSMALVKGGSLSALAAEGPVPARDAAHYIREIAGAIAYAHSKRVIHRDLKPSNILLDKDGRPKVTDFGLAKRMGDDSDLTVTGQVLGTPSYMPAEQARGDVAAISPLSDIYSLGAILYRLLAGRPPFQSASSVETLYEVIHHEPVALSQLIPNLPRDLETICFKCLDKSPSRRYQSAEQLADELTRFLNDEPILARPLSKPVRLARWCRKNPAIASMIAVTSIVLLLATIVSTSFAVIADRRADRILEMNSELVKARDDANSAAEEARQNAHIATQQSQLAFETLESVIFDIQSKLANHPAAQEVRRDLLSTGLDGLKKLSDEIRAQPRVDLTTATALLNLAEVFRQVGDEQGVGGATAATELYGRSIAILEQLVEQQPQDFGVKEQLALAYGMSGNNFTDAGSNGRARAILQKSIDLRRELLKLDESSVDAKRLLADVLVDWAYAEVNGGDLQAVLNALLESHSISLELLEADPKSLVIREHYAKTCERLGDWYYDYPKDFDTSEKYILECLRVSRELAAEGPQDYDLQIALANALERLGNLHHLRKDLHKALEAYDEELEVTQKLEVAAPYNARTQWDCSISYDKVGLVNLQLGNLDAALKASQRSYEMRIPLVEADPTNFKGHHRMSLAVKRLTTCYERLKHFDEANEAYRTGLRLLQNFTDKTGSKAFAKDIELFEQKIASVKQHATAVTD